MYLSSNAAAMAHKQNHKTFSAQDVLDSINEMDFKTFTGPMKSALVSYQKTMKDKKNSKKNSIDAQKQSQNISAPAKSTVLPANHKIIQNTVSISSDIIEIDDSD